MAKEQLTIKSLRIVFITDVVFGLCAFAATGGTISILVKMSLNTKIQHKTRKATAKLLFNKLLTGVSVSIYQSTANNYANFLAKYFVYFRQGLL
jgi:hypothetical protein